METPITEHNLKMVQSAIQIAKKYEQEFHRKLGITGEAGEVLTCYRLGLKLCDSHTKGYDAVDTRGRKVQIKTRRSEDDKRPIPTDSARIGKFGKHPFNYALLTILSRDYQIHEIWEASYRDLSPLIKARQDKGSGPSINEFKKIGKPRYQKMG